MSKHNPRRKGMGAIDVLEEAVAVLRGAPAAALACYFVGTLPFVLGLLYFWTDMARSPFAQRHLPGAAFGVALLYLWMKAWQSAFAARLLAHLAGEPAPQFPARRILRLSAQQIAWQPFGLFAVPISLLLFLPFGWVTAYYHNLAVTGSGEDPGVSDASRKAWALALLWPGQNNVIIAVVWLLWILVFLNVGSVLLLLPELLRMLTGIETVFTLSGMAVYNTTFYAVVAGITHLCVNPMLKAVYVLRCFYGESLNSGADLKAELNHAVREAARVAVIAIVLALSLSGAEAIDFRDRCSDSPRLSRGELELGCPGSSQTNPLLASRFIRGRNDFALDLTASARSAEKNAPAPTKSVVSPKKLDEAIERVINKREYQWRAPREKQDVEEERSAIVEFFQGIRDWVVKVTRPLRDLWNRLVDWLRKVLLGNKDAVPSGSRALTEEQLTLLLVLLAFAAVILAVFLWRVWRRRKETPEVVAQPVAVIPDLKDEDVVASQLPEEEWQALAAELMTKGELRLAMRALYMASLAFLAGRGMITIARYKSNRDYQKELLRRARERESLLASFSENVVLFERSWYGMHEVTPQLMETFDINHDRIRTFAQE